MQLSYGGCHGADAKIVFGELCETAEETVNLYEQDGNSKSQRADAPDSRAAGDP